MTHAIRKTKTLAAAMLSMLIIFAACKKDEPQPDPSVDAESVSISATEDFTLAIGQDTTLTASVLPETTTDKTITWTVVQEAEVVALTETAEGVTIKAEGAGVATITATAASGKSASVTVTVNVDAASVTISATEDFTLAIGQDTTLTASVLPENTTDKTIKWTVEPAEGIVTLTETAEGVTVTAAEGVSSGASATITATAVSGATASVNVNVEEETVTLSAAEDFTLDIGQDTTITASVLPEVVTDKTITWSVQPEGVVTLTPTAEGVTVTAAEGVSYGVSATITATSANNKSASVTVTLNPKGVNVNADGEWEILTEEGLIAFAKKVNGTTDTEDYNSTNAQLGLNAKLMDNITLTAPTEGGSNWTPIGWYGDSYYGYYGTFNGNGKSISGVVINSGSNFIGLFGALYNDGENKAGTVENLTLMSPVVSGGAHVGAIVGYAYKATIENCSVEGDAASVTGNSNNVGGVVGSGIYATITACYNTASVTGDYFVGGVVGDAQFTTITECYNTASVTGNSNNVGGVVGFGIYATITACYNTASASVNGSNYVGGVVGNGNSAIIITACYNTASVTGDYYVGGVVGTGTSTTITACYNTASITGTSTVGAVVGYGKSATIKTIYWINVEGDNASAAYSGTPTLAEEVVEAADTDALNNETTINALNAVIPATVTNDQGVEIAVNYHFVKGDSTPELEKKE